MMILESLIRRQDFGIMTEYFWMFYIIKIILDHICLKDFLKIIRLKKIFKFLDNESSLIDDLKNYFILPKISFH